MAGGGQPGNKNATKNRPWAEALRKTLAQYANAQAGVVMGRALERIAERVVEAAINGDMDAIEEIANRLDGKPKQQLDVDHSGTVTHEHRAVQAIDDQIARLLGDGATGDNAPPVQH